ncbi:MAG: DcaP family trimeric outer membrane transporter [Burkholderiales bacterium]
MKEKNPLHKRNSRLAQGVGVLGALGLIMLAMPAQAADDTAALKQQLEALQKKIEKLEQDQAKQQQSQQELQTKIEKTEAAIPANVITVGDDKNSIKLGNTSFSYGGYAKFDAVLNRNGNQTGGSGSAGTFSTVFFPTQSVPINGPTEVRGNRNQLALTARESRLWFHTSSPTDAGKLQTHLEFDLYGAAGTEINTNGASFRLRHAYGQLGNLLAGQFWTTFMDVPTIPETADFGGPASQVFVRQPIVRYTLPTSYGVFQFAAESPESLVYVQAAPVGVVATGSTAGAGAPPNTVIGQDRFPDLIGKYTYTGDWGNASAAVLFHQTRIDPIGLAAANANGSDAKEGAALHLSGVLKSFGKDNLKFSFLYGNVGRYAGLASFAEAAVSSNGSLSTLNVFGGFVAYQHWWTPTLRSTLVVSDLQAQNTVPNFAVNKEIRSAHVNLFWSPAPAVNYGIEYLYADRELESFQRGYQNRYQLTAKYNF